MQLINGTKFSFAANTAIDKHGKMQLLTVVKATYAIPSFPNQKAAIAEEQVPIFDADQFDADPGVSAPVFESDWSLRKKRCDIVVKANACAPDGHFVTELDVGFQVADCEKEARVVGPRKWEKSKNSKWLTPSKPEPFAELPITYENSFGGMWHDPDEEAYEFFSANPLGRGFAIKFRHELENQPLPTIEEPDHPISRSDAQYTPWAFGPLGRNWSPRVEFAGTYDDQWQKNRYPFLPTDFDEEYFQCAPADQRIDFPTGDEQVYLHNLHPTRPEIRFHLPGNLEMPMVALTRSQEQIPINPVVDTLNIDVTNNQFSIVWRGQLPLKRSMRELNIVAVGHVCKKWWQAQVYGAKDCGCGGKESDPARVISIGEALSND